MARQGTADERLGGLKQQIGEWRRMRPKPRAMPAPLWAEAARLAGELGVCRVARAAGLNVASLRRRMEGTSAGAASAGARFVEWSGGELMAAGRVAGALLEIEAADGSRLRLRFDAGPGLDLAAVVAAFGRRS